MNIWICVSAFTLGTFVSLASMSESTVEAQVPVQWPEPLTEPMNTSFEGRRYMSSVAELQKIRRQLAEVRTGLADLRAQMKDLSELDVELPSQPQTSEALE